jgi:hypothetical protein
VFAQRCNPAMPDPTMPMFFMIFSPGYGLYAETDVNVLMES